MHGHGPPISQTIQVKRRRHVGCSWSSNVELVSDTRLWTTTHWHTSINRPVKVYIYQLKDIAAYPQCTWRNKNYSRKILGPLRMTMHLIPMPNAQRIWQFLVEWNIPVLEQDFSPPDLATSNFFLFLKLS